MNALDRWKIVLTLIAIFVAGAVTGGFFMIRAVKYETPRRSEVRAEMTFAVDRWLARLHLTPDQDQKLRPIIEQADNELRNLRALDLREIEGNSRSCAGSNESGLDAGPAGTTAANAGRTEATA